MGIDPRVMRIIQKRFGYSDGEAQKFADDPRNEEVLSFQRALSQKVIVLEVVESKGCNSQHKTGDKFNSTPSGTFSPSFARPRCVRIP